MNDEIVLIDKPAGWTSFDVVAKLRGKRKAAYRSRGETPTKRQLRVGHAGTLDPFATGLLIVLYGDACKRAGEFLKLDKVYEATVRLGATSTTGDPEGEITKVDSAIPSFEQVQAALQQFTGDISQIPPAHSAIKINGQRSYKLARKGEAVIMPARLVTVHSIDILDYTYPELKIRTHVGSGTYIRSLAADIGTALQTDAYCSQLHRTRVGEWSIEGATQIDKLVNS